MLAFAVVAPDNAGGMTAYRSLARYALLPGLDVLRGTHVGRCLTELEWSQWWTAERLTELQNQRLQRLVRHTYERVSYYRRVMDGHGLQPASIRTAADLARLPVLTREDVREHLEELVADGFPRGELLPSRTSGSTGTPLAFYSSRQSRWSHGAARALRAMQWAGVHPGDRVVRVVGGGSFVADAPFGRLSRLLSREVFENPIDFTDVTLPEVVSRITSLRPHALRGYTSAICVIAEYLRSAGHPAPPVGAIVTGGEQLSDGQRALIRGTFNVEPFSKYSSFENYEMAMECEEHSGLHVAAEDMIVEVVDDSGRPAQPGEVGRVLVTSLHEYGMPLIRYDTADEASWLESSCACGRSLPRLSPIIGRVCDIIYTPSGKRLSANSLDSSGLVSLGIRQFQLVQETLAHVTVRVVPLRAPVAGEVNRLSDAVRVQFAGWLGDDMKVDVAIVDRIESTPAGKHLYLISHVKRP